jgi:succinate dehydrogenase / fumarate reductase membrane anchor subunit
VARVTPVASLGRSGLQDWIVQRVSALVLAVYFLFILGYLIAHPDLTYVQWAGLHGMMIMKVFNTLSLLLLLAHVWIGVWGVLTDYVTPRIWGHGADLARSILLFLVIAVICVVAVFGIGIFWSV